MASSIKSILLLLLLCVVVVGSCVFADSFLDKVDKKPHKSTNKCAQKVAKQVCGDECDTTDMACLVKCIDEHPDEFKKCHIHKRHGKKNNNNDDDSNVSLRSAINNKLVDPFSPTANSTCPWMNVCGL
jgi:hypothetical protein